jgi:hypothetical protein
MPWLARSALCLALLACNDPRAGKDAANDATAFTRQHAKHKLHASVAGHDCRVLVISTKAALNKDLVESIQYGTGDYMAFGGADQFAHERGFRAVVYRDSTGAFRTYGAITRDEAQSMPHCR